MGPFPHSAPRSEITVENPAGTDGFEFVEFAHPEPQELRDVFSRMGYAHVGTHKTKAIELWQQGDVTYILNADLTALRPSLSNSTALARPQWAGGWRMPKRRLITLSPKALCPTQAMIKRCKCLRLKGSAAR